MTEKTLNVAIVGSGIIGHAHARVAIAHPRLRLVALVDVVPDQNDDLADYVEHELHAERPRGFGSLAEALVGTDIDLVVVGTPSGTHVQLAGESIAAGKHVIIEKPLDVSMQHARRLGEIAEEAKAKGLVVSVISQHRFDPANVAVSRAIEAGRFGRLTSATANVSWYRSQEYYDSGDWRGTWELDGGGALMNQGVHTVDLLVHFMGTPVEVYAHTGLLGHNGIEVEDVAGALVRFESGALATLLATTNAFPGMATRIEVHGSKGSAVTERDRLAYFHAADAHPAGAATGGAAGNQAAAEVGEDDLASGAETPELFAGHLRQYEDIVDAIATGREPGVTVADATVALALVRSVYASQTIGGPVRFADVLNGHYDELRVATGADLGAAEITTTEVMA
jgi:UDP-N-acetyl-2-amino-2-deoxyglucuronate dehydrogenase